MWYPSRYGPDDILGAMNLVTPESILAAVGLIKKGVVYDLSHNLDQDMPIPGFHDHSSQIPNLPWRMAPNGMTNI